MSLFWARPSRAPHRHSHASSALIFQKDNSLKMTDFYSAMSGVKNIKGNTVNVTALMGKVGQTCPTYKIF